MKARKLFSSLFAVFIAISLLISSGSVVYASPSERTVSFTIRNLAGENITEQCTITVIDENGIRVTPETPSSFRLMSYDEYRISIRATDYKPLSTTWYVTNVYSKEFTLQTQYINIAGKNRYQTAVEICKQAFKGGVPSKNLVLVYGGNYPDALSANSLAGSLNAPLLLTERNTLSKATADYLRTEDGQTIRNVVFVGGGFSNKVINDLVALGIPRSNIDTTSCAGTNRYDTSVKTCRYQLDKLYKGKNQIAIATGQNPADSLSFSTFSYQNRIPILLTENGELSSEARELAKQYKLITYLGGENAVHDIPGVPNYLGSYNGIRPSNLDRTYAIRVGGANRYETSIKICEYYQSYHPERSYDTVFVSGLNENYPDALVAGMMSNAYSHDEEPPVILTSMDQNPVINNYIDKKLNQDKSDGYNMYFVGKAAKGNSTIYDWVTMAIGAVG